VALVKVEFDTTNRLEEVGMQQAQAVVPTDTGLLSKTGRGSVVLDIALVAVALEADLSFAVAQLAQAVMATHTVLRSWTSRGSVVLDTAPVAVALEVDPRLVVAQLAMLC